LFDLGESVLFDFNKYDVRLMFNLLKMNIRDRYLGSTLGGLWAITNPLLMLGLYTYVFGFVFKVKLPGSETTLTYVIWLISGYGPWLAMTEAIMGGTNSVIGASGLVKNMAFKTELLPISGALVGLISISVCMVFLCMVIIISNFSLSIYVLLLPIVIAIQFFFAIGLSMWLSVIAVFIRDIVQILPTLLMVIMFVTPIFYPYDSLPEVVKSISVFNPFFQLSDAYRSILIRGEAPSFIGLTYVLFIGFILFVYGLKMFRRAKGYFDSAM
jgi:lipopolysaccharide transport system permease protein